MIAEGTHPSGTGYNLVGAQLVQYSVRCLFSCKVEPVDLCSSTISYCFVSVSCEAG